MNKGIRRPVFGEIFRICMMGKSGKKLYLEVIDAYMKKGDRDYTRTYGWTMSKRNGAQFVTEEEAKDVASKWFKNFTGWFIEPGEEYLGSI